MSRRAEGLIFVGRLPRTTRQRDLEEMFDKYGYMLRCELKYGAEMAYGFIDFEDRRDADDAIRRENGRYIMGSSIIVEWARGQPRRPLAYDECYKCGRTGHWARDCPDDRRGGGGGGGRSRRRGRDRSYSRDRSRSRSRERRRRRSHSRSPSYERSKRRRSYSRSVSPAKNGRSRSRSISPARSKSGSRSRSRD